MARGGILPKRLAKAGTKLNNKWVGSYHMRWSVNTPAVWLIQSANEILKYGLTKHSRKENLTKDNIPTIFESVIDTQNFEEYKVQRNNKHCSIGKEKQSKKSTGNLWPASASEATHSIAICCIWFICVLIGSCCLHESAQVGLVVLLV